MTDYQHAVVDELREIEISIRHAAFGIVACLCMIVLVLVFKP